VSAQDANGRNMAFAIAAAKMDDWQLAQSEAAKINDPVAGDIITWLHLRSGGPGLKTYREFLKRNADWPGLKLVRKRGEAAIPANHTPKRVIAYFQDQEPQTGRGAIRLAEALWSVGDKKGARAEMIRVWTTYSLRRVDRLTMLDRYGTTLKKYHNARLDMLLWRGLHKQAEAMFSLVDDAQVKLARARIGLRKKVNGVDALIEAVPKSLAGDPGLAYERFLWRARKGLRARAVELLRSQSKSTAGLGRPEEWSNRRRQFARQAMRNGNNRRAYDIASNHHLTSGSDYADLEWLAGYIALRKLNDPELALRHFTDFRAAIATPISYGRAGYWQGRAYEAMGDALNAQIAYEFAAGYQTSFYGQLAAEKAGVGADAMLNGQERFPDWRNAAFTQTTVIRAALLFHIANEPARAEQFFRQLAETQDRTGLLQLTQLALDIGRPNIAVRVAKQAARQGHVIPHTYFPVTELARKSGGVKPEIAMSIARRESELDQFIISPAGARGLMQLMPGTAKKVARELGISYSLGRLTSDWKYNARLGTTYLEEQLKDFNGSYILAFAAYNAGPHRARRWIETYGDPRRDSVDQIDWIEHIPFRETRNYVMRVIESLHVYRARISGKVAPLRITRDLQRG